MLEQIEELRSELDVLTEQVEEHDDLSAQMFEMLLRVKAKLEALEEVLTHTHIVDGSMVKELEECNFLESVHILSQT